MIVPSIEADTLPFERSAMGRCNNGVRFTYRTTGEDISEPDPVMSRGESSAKRKARKVPPL
jgi:hypothetical protein